MINSICLKEPDTDEVFFEIKDLEKINVFTNIGKYDPFNTIFHYYLFDIFTVIFNHNTPKDYNLFQPKIKCNFILEIDNVFYTNNDIEKLYNLFNQETYEWINDVYFTTPTFPFRSFKIIIKKLDKDLLTPIQQKEEIDKLLHTENDNCQFFFETNSPLIINELQNINVFKTSNEFYYFFKYYGYGNSIDLIYKELFNLSTLPKKIDKLIKQTYVYINNGNFIKTEENIKKLRKLTDNPEITKLETLLRMKLNKRG